MRIDGDNVEIGGPITCLDRQMLQRRSRGHADVVNWYAHLLENDAPSEMIECARREAEREHEKLKRAALRALERGARRQPALPSAPTKLGVTRPRARSRRARRCSVRRRTANADSDGSGDATTFDGQLRDSCEAVQRVAGRTRDAGLSRVVDHLAEIVEEAADAVVVASEGSVP